VTIRASAVIVMLSVSLSAVEPLICQIVCAPTPAASQPCHGADPRLRVSAGDHHCDYAADPAAMTVLTGKAGPVTRDIAIAGARWIGARAVIAVFVRGAHGPPGSAPTLRPAAGSILRI
jgi:hypothetical protein